MILVAELHQFLVWVGVYVVNFMTILLSYYCVFRGDASSGVKRKGMKYLDDAKVMVGCFVIFLKMLI